MAARLPALIPVQTQVAPHFLVQLVRRFLRVLRHRPIIFDAWAKVERGKSADEFLRHRSSPLIVVLTVGIIAEQCELFVEPVVP